MRCSSCTYVTGIAIKPNSTNIYAQNITCDRTSGVAIGSLGQYEGVFDLAENITIKDTTVSIRPTDRVPGLNGHLPSSLVPPTGHG